MFEWISTEVVQRLRSRFKLQAYPLDPDRLALARIVFPVTSIDEMLKTPDIATSGDISITSAADFVFHTVPAGKRWTLKAYKLGLYTGVYTFGLAWIGDEHAHSMTIDTLASVTSAALLLPEGLKLGPGWTINALVDGWTSIGNARMYVYIEEEDVYAPAV